MKINPIKKHPLYKFIIHAYTRCRNKNHPYSKKGIKFNFESVEKAIEYIEINLGYPPTLKHTIDRINTNGHYESNNIRWATASQQMQNRNLKSKLGIHGVSLISKGKYLARIKYNKKTYRIGIFKSVKLALLAYQACAWVLYG